MDRERFDQISRALGRKGGRRQALMAALGVGAAVTVGTRSALAANKRPGDLCTRADTCRNYGGSYYYCGYNGFDYDGPANCCTDGGGYCEAAEHCCGTNSCINNVCQYVRGLAGAGKGCWTNDDCDTGNTGLVCAFNDWDNNSKVCCNYSGGPCQYDGHCCGSAPCVNGFCA